MADVRELLQIVKDNRKLLADLQATFKAAADADATGQQVDDFTRLVARTRTEILEGKNSAAADKAGQPDPAARKEAAREALKTIQECKARPGLSQGDMALLDAQEADLGITIASSSFEGMQPFGELLTDKEWDELVGHFEEATKDLANRKRAKAFLDGAVKLAILAAKVASKL